MIKAFSRALLRLSDSQLEDRLNFRRFARLPLDQRVPDFSTFWRFRDALAAERLIEELFAQITRQLEDKRLILRRGTVVEASIIESSGRPLSNEDCQQLAKEPPFQIDTDADLTKKGGHYFFGYKAHIRVD